MFLIPFLCLKNAITQPDSTYPTLTIETLEQGVQYVQS